LQTLAGALGEQAFTLSDPFPGVLAWKWLTRFTPLSTVKSTLNYLNSSLLPFASHQTKIQP